MFKSVGLCVFVMMLSQTQQIMGIMLNDMFQL